MLVIEGMSLVKVTFFHFICYIFYRYLTMYQNMKYVDILIQKFVHDRKQYNLLLSFLSINLDVYRKLY